MQRSRNVIRRVPLTARWDYPVDSDKADMSSPLGRGQHLFRYCRLVASTPVAQNLNSRQRHILISAAITLVVASLVQSAVTSIWPNHGRLSNVSFFIALILATVVPARWLWRLQHNLASASDGNGSLQSTGSDDPDFVLTSPVDRGSSSPYAAVRSLTPYFWPKAVALSSPLDCETCDQRLRHITEPELLLLPPETGALGPRFGGKVDSDHIRIARLGDKMRLKVGVPWLRGSLAGGSNGGTELRGTIGMSPLGMTAVLLAFTVGALLLAASLVAGAVFLFQDHGYPAATAILITVALSRRAWSLPVSGTQSIAKQTQQLLDDTGALLECFDVSVGRATG